MSNRFKTRVKVALPTAADRHRQMMHGYDLRLLNKQMPHRANHWVQRGWEMADIEIKSGRAHPHGVSR